MVNSQESHPWSDDPIGSLIADAAKTAGATLATRFGSSLSIAEKGSGNLVTDADFASEEILVRCIRSHFPDDFIMTEESDPSQPCVSELGQIPRAWIIDPLDGTNNFAHGIPHFAISIACLQMGKTTHGLVYNPSRGDLYYASPEGCWANGQRISRLRSRPLSESIVAFGFYYDRGKMMERTLDTVRDFFLNKVHGVRRMGTAALDLIGVALGQYGVFFEYQLQPWDFAAGKFFVESVGGRVTDCHGNKLDPLKPSSLLAGSSDAFEEALQIVRPQINKLDAKA